MRNRFLTFDEIIEDQLSQIGEEDKKAIKGIHREDLLQYHPTVGLMIRNVYRLWEPENPLTWPWHRLRSTGNQKDFIAEEGFDYHPMHPDEVSMQILYTLWDKVNGKE